MSFQLIVAAMLGAATLSGCANLQPASNTGNGRLIIGPSDRPKTVPALRMWHGEPGVYALTRASRLVILTAEESTIRDTATVFAEDLKALSNYGVPIVVSPPDLLAGDIQLSLGAADPNLPDEGYAMRIGSSITITARTTAGLFYGTRTLLQLFNQSYNVPAGRVSDWPGYPERGMMIDIARKYFTPRWLEQHVRELAYLKMNYLHLHISDDEGFGIESSHPGFKSSCGRQLSKDQVRDLVSLATRYHVTIVPEIDMPGHMKAVLNDERYRDYRLHNIFGISNSEVLDITNPEAVSFAEDIIKEYLGLFAGSPWHLGADEVLPPWTLPFYPASSRDAINGFINEIDTFLQSILPGNPIEMRVWNDQLGRETPGVKINTDIVIEWWADFSFLSDWNPLGPQDLIDEGYTIINSGWWPTYHDTAAIVFPPNPLMSAAYETWSVNEFNGPLYLSSQLRLLPPKIISPNDPKNLGANLNVWNDHPNFSSEEDIARAIYMPLHVIAQKTWDSPQLTESYPEFQRIVRRIGQAPAP